MAKYKKRADGRYRADVTIGFDAEGNRTRKTLYGITIKELEAKIADIKSLQNKGLVISDSKITLKQWAEKWLDSYKQGVAYNTREMYRHVIEKHIATADIAVFPLVKIKTVDLQKLVNTKQEEGLTRTIDILVLTLRQIFDQAVENDLLYKNPAKALKKPQTKTPPKRALYDIEKKAIEKANLSASKRAFVYLGMYAGMRRGEILALTQGDIDLKEKTVTVSKTIVFKKNTGEIQHFPKSEAGFRTIPMPTILYNFIAEHLKSLGSIYLFTGEEGGLFSKTAAHRLWRSIMSKLNKAVAVKGSDIVPITGLTPHILRHEYATSLYYAGVDIKTAQKLLGHSDIKMTLAIYTHLEQDNKDVTHKLDNLYCGKIAVKGEKTDDLAKQKTSESS